MPNRVLAATPVHKAPAAVPMRYVLCEINWKESRLPLEYVVWEEYFSETEPDKHAGYGNGKYFTLDKFADAYEAWVKKANEFKAYLDSWFGEKVRIL